MPKVTIYGAGPAGLSCALAIARRGVEVTVIEKNFHVGGNASSFEFGGVNVDFGSHRLHPASDPLVLDQIRSLLGEDLLTRPRHGRIRLLGRWIHFPLRPVDLLLKGNPRFTLGVLSDIAGKVFKPKTRAQSTENFATVLSAGLGKTICEQFYFPYARKIWGLEPEELSAVQAHKRVSAGTLKKMITRLLPSSKATGGANTKGIFYYPKQGFGQICNAYYAALQEAGVVVHFNATIKSVSLTETVQRTTYELDGEEFVLESDHVFSTIPVNLLASFVEPKYPSAVAAAAADLSFRSMVLVYLQLNQDKFTEYDAHYFPGSDIPFTRVSEPKNYANLSEPSGTTVLCVEVPCFYDDEIWNADAATLSKVIERGLTQSGVPITGEVTDTTIRKIRFAYPLYKEGAEENFATIDQWAETLDGVTTYGRQGLYAHDNTHHAIMMGLKAAECLDETGRFDTEAWSTCREAFKSHVVED